MNGQRSGYGEGVARPVQRHAEGARRAEGAWIFYIADVWRKGTVGCFDRFLSAWHQSIGTASAEGLPPMPMGLTVDDGINTFSSMTLQAAGPMSNPALRRWVGEVFIDRLLPTMAGRVVDPNYDFPAVGLQPH